MKYTENTKATQSGMTLIELSVVLLVMVGLAGVAVPYVAGMADKAHDSTTGSTISQLNQSIASFRGNHNALPDRLETLVDGSGALYSKLMSEVNYAGATFGNPVALGSVGLVSLRKAGLTSVLNNLSTPAQGNATFGSTDGTVVPLTATVKVAPVAPLYWLAAGPKAATGVAEHLAYALGGNKDQYSDNEIDSDHSTAGKKPGCYTYFGLGIGDNNEMIGSSMQSAPILFMPNGDMNPEKKYARFIAIMKVHTKLAYDGTCPDTEQPASFVGTVAAMDFKALIGSASSQQWATSSARQAN
jgi:prepilin-type N-terminal cleavage/methylation domain-containing protein